MFSRITPSFTPESRGKSTSNVKTSRRPNASFGNQDPFSHRVHTGKVISNHAKPARGLFNVATTEAKAEKSSARGDNRQHTDNKPPMHRRRNPQTASRIRSGSARFPQQCCRRRSDAPVVSAHGSPARNQQQDADHFPGHCPLTRHNRR